jgi:hypothetical protein
MDSTEPTAARYPITSVSKAAKVLALLADAPQLRLSDVTPSLGHLRVLAPPLQCSIPLQGP